MSMIRNSDLDLLSLIEFNKSNNTGARILDSKYHIAFNMDSKCIFGVKRPRFCQIIRNVIMDAIT